MTFWIIALRVSGSLLFLVGVVGGVSNALNLQVFEDFWWTTYHVWLPVIEDLVLSMLCFGAAAALRQIRQTDQRIARATAARRRPAQSQMQALNLAPHAPVPTSTVRYMDEGEKIRYGGNRGRTFRRIDQEYIDRKYTYRVPDPEVRAAPPPIRTTPGAEDQYAADTQQLHAFRPSTTPPPSPARMNVEADRDILKRGRDKQIRRAQAEQIRSRKQRSQSD